MSDDYENPYADAVDLYRDQGWPSVIPLGRQGERAAKGIVPKGVTGRDARVPADADHRRWKRSHAVNNVGIYLGDGWLGVDVDAYDDKHGDEVIAALEERYGNLPPTIRITSRGRDPEPGRKRASGIHIYRVPPGLEFITKLPGDVEIIQAKHRYVCAWPSISDKTGKRYETWDDRDPDAGPLDGPPSPDDAAELSKAWIQFLIENGAAGKAASPRTGVTDEQAREWMREHGAGSMCRAMRNVLAEAKDKVAAARKDGTTRHDVADEQSWALVQLVVEGHRGGMKAINALGEAFHAALEEQRLAVAKADGEWTRMVVGAVDKARAVMPANWSQHPANECPNREGWSPHDEFTDAALVDRLAGEMFDGRFCWGDGLGWMRWDGRRWRKCPEAAIGEAVRGYMRGWFADEVRRGADADRIKRLIALESRARIAAIISLARGKMLVEPNQFDAHPDLLNVANGVVDLSTGVLRDHDPALYLTKIAGAAYRPDATHPAWVEVLESLPADCRGYVVSLYGQALTGHAPPEGALLVMSGVGQNGKSTLVSAIKRAFGDYAIQVASKLLLADRESHSADVMTLRGARLAYVEELPEGRKLNMTRVKQLIDTPEITGRELYQNPVTFRATFTLVVNTNYEPLVAETDAGTWRRLRLIRFPFRFRSRNDPLQADDDRKGDPSLRDRVLADERIVEAVLADLVSRAVTWYAEDRQMPDPPERVDADTRRWRMNDDLAMRYFDERLVVNPDAHITVTDLAADLGRWLEGGGHIRWGEKTITQRFTDHDALPVRMEKKPVRRDSKTYGKLSRPQVCVTDDDELGARYKAWIGVAFASDDAPGNQRDDDLDW